jgi:hypothetical protein
LAKQKKYVSRNPNSPRYWTWHEKMEAVVKKVDEAKAERAVAASAMTQKPKGWADEGRKDDSGKLPYDLLPHDAIEEIVKVLQFGANKYAARNWEKGMHWSRPYAALMRHMYAWWRGQGHDPETGMTHLAHAGCCILFLLALERRNQGTDDRPSTETYPDV